MLSQEFDGTYVEQLEALSDNYGITAKTADQYIRKKIKEELGFDDERVLAEMAEQEFIKHHADRKNNDASLHDIVSFFADYSEVEFCRQVYHEADLVCHRLLDAYDGRYHDPVEEIVDDEYDNWRAKRDCGDLDEHDTRTDEDWEERPLDQPEVQTEIGRQALICVCIGLGNGLQEVYDDEQMARDIRKKQDIARGMDGESLVTFGNMRLYDDPDTNQVLRSLDLGLDIRQHYDWLLLVDDKLQVTELDNWQGLPQVISAAAGTDADADEERVKGWQLLEKESIYYGTVHLYIEDTGDHERQSDCLQHYALLYYDNNQEDVLDLQTFKTQLSQTRDLNERAALLYDNTSPVDAYDLQCGIKRGMKMLEMQENMQSLTASQSKEDSLNAGLKNGGQGRH